MISFFRAKFRCKIVYLEHSTIQMPNLHNTNHAKKKSDYKNSDCKTPTDLILFFERFQFVGGKFSKNDVVVDFPVNGILDAGLMFRSAS